MERCEYYHEKRRIIKWDPPRGSVFEDYSMCYGTKEWEECRCCGDRTKCDFYPEVRENALKENKE